MSLNKKEQILLAASECFAIFGYKKTTLEDIGQKIGLNKASIYYYFKSKEEIFTVIVLNEFRQFINNLHQDIGENMACEDKISKYFVEKLRYWFQKSMILPQITEIGPLERQHLMTSGKEIYVKIEEEEKLFLSNILRKCIRDSQIKDCDVDKMSEFMFALVDGVKDNYIELAKSLTRSIEFEDMIKDVQTALNIFVNGLKFNDER